MMFHYVIVKSVVLVGLIGMYKTGCFGETSLVLHVPSSSRARKRLNYYYHQGWGLTICLLSYSYIDFPLYNMAKSSMRKDSYICR